MLNKNLLFIAAAIKVDGLSRRHSRFVEVKAPDLESRQEILQYYCDSVDVKLKSSTIQRMAKDTDGLDRRSLEYIIMFIQQKMGISDEITYQDIKRFIQDRKKLG